MDRAELAGGAEGGRDKPRSLCTLIRRPQDGGERDASERAASISPCVALVDMGHTHYNELANDGRTIFAATRSTGQIEEGPVGYSIATIDAES